MRLDRGLDGVSINSYKKTHCRNTSAFKIIIIITNNCILVNNKLCTRIPSSLKIIVEQSKFKKYLPNTASIIIRNDCHLVTNVCNEAWIFS